MFALTLTFYRAIGPDSGAFAVNTYHKGATIIWRIRANIPAGYTIGWASNATGTGSTATWLTSQAGTGAYFEYVLRLVTGTSGTFSSTGFFFLSGTAPVTWHVAMCSAVCISHPTGFGVWDVDVNRRPNIDFSQSSHLNKNQDNVGDGTTFKRLLNVNADNTFHVSSSLNQQASVLPNQAVLITYQVPSTSQIFGSWLAQSLTRPDQSIISVASSQGTVLDANGDFETSAVGVAPASWTNFGGGTFVTANDQVHGGSKSGKISVSANTCVCGQGGLSVTGGLVYCIEGWINTQAMVTIAGHGAFISVTIDSGVTNLQLQAYTGTSNAGNTNTATTINMGYAADGSAHGWGFFQAYFIPNISGQIQVNLVDQTSSTASVWFDDVKLYQHNGIYYSGLGAGNSYYVYPRITVSGNTGTINFVNGNPPSTSPSDSLALSTGYDGNISVSVSKITMPNSGGGGTISQSGGGSGSCTEFNQSVDIQRYADDGTLQFEGVVRAGDVRTGYESDDGTIKRGDFLKGYSFAQQQDVFRAVTFYQHVPCGGWMIVNGYKVTACESVYVNGAWMPAWKAPNAQHNSDPGLKVQLQVEADWDDEHNYYLVGQTTDLLIHNYIPAS